MTLLEFCSSPAASPVFSLPRQPAAGARIRRPPETRHPSHTSTLCRSRPRSALFNKSAPCPEYARHMMVRTSLRLGRISRAYVRARNMRSRGPHARNGGRAFTARTRHPRPQRMPSAREAICVYRTDVALLQWALISANFALRELRPEVSASQVREPGHLPEVSQMLPATQNEGKYKEVTKRERRAMPRTDSKHSCKPLGVPRLARAYHLEHARALVRAVRHAEGKDLL